MRIFIIDYARKMRFVELTLNTIHDVYQNSPAICGGAILINMPVFLFCWEIFIALCGGWPVAGGIWLSAVRSLSHGLQ